MVHELLALELLTVLLENPTSDSVEVGIGFLKESGMKLTELSPKGVHGMWACDDLCGHVMMYVGNTVCYCRIEI